MSKDSDEEIVYVPAQGNGNGNRVVHTDRYCSQLQKARKIHEYPRDSLQHLCVCKYCSDDIPDAGGTNSGPWEKLVAADSDDLITDGGSSLQSGSNQFGGDR